MIRLANEGDAAEISAIYAPCVRNTPISFETAPPSPAEMAERITATLPRRPWLVQEADGAIVGYAYASPFAQRVCYRWSVTTSVYVRDDQHRRGVGRSLYRALLSLLAEQGFRSAYAGVTLPNEGSVGLHKAMGFEPVGVYRDAGHKLGRWHDVAWFQRALQPNAPRVEELPAEPLEVSAVLAAQAPLWAETEWSHGG
ncbi:MAG: arsinothricin resistance N-acetyltransferase ArsN1 family B [Burkholderiaceae bacterium]